MKQFKQLTREERYIIHSLLKEGFSPIAIAINIGKHSSTVYREIERNKGLRGYRPRQAHLQARERSSEAHRHSKFLPEVRALVDHYIGIEYSPEQISNYLRKEHCISISTERIYQYIWADKSAGGHLYLHLRQGTRQRRKRSKSYDSRGQIANRVSIDERPAIVEKRARIGDWEVDTILGKRHRGVCVTVVDRVSKYTLIKNLPSKHADRVADAIIELLMPHKDKVHTITGDNGKEFAQHEKIAEKLAAKFYFAHPYSSWERGTNENTNGLIRQYLPKGMDLSKIQDADIAFVRDRLNFRPRKSLNYSNPDSIFFGEVFLPPCREGEASTIRNNYIEDIQHKSVALAT